VALAFQPSLLTEKDASRKETSSVEFLSKPCDIAALTERAKPLLADFAATAGPRFFLASITPSLWIPRVVVIQRGALIEGIVYTKERKLAGLRTGMLFGHSTLGTLVVASPGQREAVLEQALTALLASKRTSGIRLLVPPQGFEMAVSERVVQRSKASRRQIEFSHRTDSDHQVVPLQASYESFLNTLSYKARRNMRYYRRRYEAAGHHYVGRMDLAEFRRIAYRLLDRSVVGGKPEGVTRALGMFSEADRPILAGLRRADGQWVAILGGWYEGDNPVVLFQMNNDRDYSAESLSAVLRAYFIEDLIAHGCRQVFFWAGVSGPVARGAQPYPSSTVSLDAGTRRWRALRRLCMLLAPHLPRRIQWAVDWIASSSGEPCIPKLPEPA
jgi:hypothetical protein